MHRWLPIIVGPELVMLLINVAVYLFCARHTAGESRFVGVLEKLIWFLPVLATTAVFLTIFVPGAKTWWWLGRAIVVSVVGTMLFTYRMVEGFGSGARGQDAALILAFTFSGITAAIGTAVSLAMIYAAKNPAFADWFRMRPVIGSLLTLLAAVPIGFVLVLGLGAAAGVLMGLWFEFRK